MKSFFDSKRRFGQRLETTWWRRQVGVVRLSLAVTIAGLIISGCASKEAPESGGETDQASVRTERWKEERRKRIANIEESPDKGLRDAVWLINLADSVKIADEENRIHGAILQRIWKADPDLWRRGLERARKRSADSAEVLREAYLEGAEFIKQPELILLQREETPSGEGEAGDKWDQRMSIDLSL